MKELELRAGGIRDGWAHSPEYIKRTNMQGFAGMTADEIAPFVGHFSGGDEIEARRGERLSTSQVFVDGLGIGDIGNVVLRDRRHLSQDGFIVCIVVLDEFDGDVLYGPEIISRGFVYMRDSEQLIERAEQAVLKVLKKKKKVPISVLENKIRDSLGTFASREMGRRPMILPLVMEV